MGVIDGIDQIRNNPTGNKPSRAVTFFESFLLTMAKAQSNKKFRMRDGAPTFVINQFTRMARVTYITRVDIYLFLPTCNSTLPLQSVAPGDGAVKRPLPGRYCNF